MRTLVAIALFCPIVGLACGETDVGPRETRPAVNNPEAEAARIFEIAENLKKNGKDQEASEAYQQIVREFPRTVQGKKAAARTKGVRRRK